MEMHRYKTKYKYRCGDMPQDKVHLGQAAHNGGSCHREPGSPKSRASVVLHRVLGKEESLGCPEGAGRKKVALMKEGLVGIEERWVSPP